MFRNYSRNRKSGEVIYHPGDLVYLSKSESKYRRRYV